MKWRDSVGGWVLVASVTILIWFVAATETRTPQDFFHRVLFRVTGSTGEWVIHPAQTPVTIRVEGSKLALRQLENVLRSEKYLVVELPAEATTSRAVDLVQRLKEDERIRATGVSVLTSEPGVVELSVDELHPLPAAIQARFPGSVQVDEVEVTPAEVRAWIPRSRRGDFPEKLVVVAAIEPKDLENLEPGRRHTRELRLQPPPEDPWPDVDGLSISPPKASVSFVLRSRIEPMTLDSVRVHVAGPHEDFQEYDIDLDPTVLRQVTILVDRRVKDLIEAGKASVVAVIHLSYRDKEQAIESKPVAYFQALREGWTTAEPVTATGPMPEIRLRIRRRDAAGPGGTQH